MEMADAVALGSAGAGANSRPPRQAGIAAPLSSAALFDYAAGIPTSGSRQIPARSPSRYPQDDADAAAHGPPQTLVGRAASPSIPEVLDCRTRVSARTPPLPAGRPSVSPQDTADAPRQCRRAREAGASDAQDQ